MQTDCTVCGHAEEEHALRGECEVEGCECIAFEPGEDDEEEEE